MLAKGSVGADGAPENDARLRHRRSDHVRIVALLGRALVEKIAVRAPRFRSRLHGRSGDRQVEEPQRGLEVFSFLAMRRFPAPLPLSTGLPYREGALDLGFRADVNFGPLSFFGYPDIRVEPETQIPFGQVEPLILQLGLVFREADDKRLILVTGTCIIITYMQKS